MSMIGVSSVVRPPSTSVLVPVMYAIDSGSGVRSAVGAPSPPVGAARTQTPADAPSVGFWTEASRRFRTRKLSMLALGFVLFLFLVALLAPAIVGTKPIVCKYKGSLYFPCLGYFYRGWENPIFFRDRFRGVYPENLKKKDPESWAVWPLVYQDPYRRVRANEWPDLPANPYGPDGRPKLVPDKEPTPGGNIVCPSLAGATNWMSPAYHPGTGLFYVQATEQCQIFTKRDQTWQRGKGYFGGAANNIPGEPEAGYLRALDIKTGEKVWEIRQSGEQRSWGGALSTDGGLVFYGDASGAFAAADAKTGELLWNFHANEQWKASPMTYTVAGKQYVAVASGLNVIAFALPGE